MEEGTEAWAVGCPRLLALCKHCRPLLLHKQGFTVLSQEGAEGWKIGLEVNQVASGRTVGGRAEAEACYELC